MEINDTIVEEQIDVVQPQVEITKHNRKKKTEIKTKQCEIVLANAKTFGVHFIENGIKYGISFDNAQNYTIEDIGKEVEVEYEGEIGTKQFKCKLK